jgi:hypothetical protein
LLQATPSWASNSKIADFYLTADALGMWTGIWHEVDHAIPLQGKAVCGLHVESNLQVLERSENRRKGIAW